MIDFKTKIFPLTLGTFGLGYSPVESSHDGEDDIRIDHMDALQYSFDHGQNFIETSYSYGGGKTMEFLAGFFQSIPRDQIFITTKLEKYVEKIDDVESQLDRYLQIMGLDYVDSFLLHAPSFTRLPLEETYLSMQKMIEKGKVRFLSGSNLSYEQLERLSKIKISLFSIELLYNLECKINEDRGIIDFCQKNDILITNYQPLRRNRIARQNIPILVELSKKYNKTQNQILLNWLVKWKGFYPLIRSSRIDNVRENFDALNFILENKDYILLDNYRSERFDALSDTIDWEEGGKGIPIYKLANHFN